MRLGMVGRADPRGLGIQSAEFFRWMRPDATLVVDLGRLSPYPMMPTLYEPDGSQEVIRARFAADRLPVEAMEWLLDRSDVIWTAETPYDMRLLEMARYRGVKTVIHGNFEFMRWVVNPELPRPDLFLAPSTWQLDRWPVNTLVFHFPVARDRLRFRRRVRAATFLHVVGHRAMRDRAGTKLFLSAAGHSNASARFLIRSQDRMSSNGHGVEVRVGTEPDYWKLYDEGDVLVAPRRYGGQSLPLNEALSCGMPVVALDREPERSILPSECLVPAWEGSMRVPSGQVDYWEADPRALAEKMDELAANPDVVRSLSERADFFAETLSWEHRVEDFRKVLASLL